jgi:hypothetical protein
MLALLNMFLPAAFTSPTKSLPLLRVSENKHFIVTGDGRPFFWLGDTAWELFHRLNREEAEFYLRKRAGQGYNVVQAVILAEFDGLGTPNSYGHVPLRDNDPAKPNEAYFEHVDWILARAESLGKALRLGATERFLWSAATWRRFGRRDPARRPPAKRVAGFGRGFRGRSVGAWRAGRQVGPSKAAPGRRTP